MDQLEPVPTGARDLRHHGGNINEAGRQFPQAPLPWIDLSTGINPVPYPVGPIAAAAWARLPEPGHLAELEDVARRAYGAPDTAGIVAAAGTQALIQWLPRIVPASRVGVLGLTYGEHETCWRAAGADVTIVPSPDDLAAFDVGVIVNPNNPDGRLHAPGTLTDLATTLARNGGRLIVDESFMDVIGPHSSLVPHLPVANAIVLRSFGKTYGLAGVRLGFALAAPETTAQLRAAMGPWAVSGPAIEIARQALADNEWLTATITRLSQEAGRLDRLLQSAGFEIIGGTALFRLARHEHAARWFDRLCQAGILTRPFRARPTWLRLGIPHAPEDWARLQAALEGPLASWQASKDGSF